MVNVRGFVAISQISNSHVLVPKIHHCNYYIQLLYFCLLDT